MGDEDPFIIVINYIGPEVMMKKKNRTTGKHASYMKDIRNYKEHWQILDIEKGVSTGDVGGLSARGFGGAL